MSVELFRQTADTTGVLGYHAGQCRSAEIGATTPHSLWAAGITIYMVEGGSLEDVQQIAAHESPRTTKRFDCSNDAVAIGEIERMRL